MICLQEGRRAKGHVNPATAILEFTTFCAQSADHKIAFQDFKRAMQDGSFVARLG